MRNNFTMHLKNIYAEGELPVEATCKELLQVQTEGSRQVERKKSCGKLNYYKKNSGILRHLQMKTEVSSETEI